MRNILTGVALGAAATFAFAAAPQERVMAPRPATQAAATQAESVAAALAAGKALALIEVTAMRERDGRPADGNLVETVNFKTIKSSGTVPESIQIIKAFGGMRMGPPPVPRGPLFPNPLAVGQRYWVIFNDTDFEKYQQGVVAWWPEKDAPKDMEAAATSDRYGKGVK